MNPISGTQFGSAATTAAIATSLGHSRRDRLMKQRDPNAMCYIERFNQTVKNAVIKPKAQPVRFGMDGDSYGDSSLGHDLEQAAEGWALGKAADKLLTAEEKNYRALEKWSKPSNHFVAGQSLLGTARHVSNTGDYYKNSEMEFVKAAGASAAHTHKALAHRHAAIAAKLRGDGGTAKGHHSRGVAARKNATIDRDWRPDRDIRHMNEEANFLANKVAQPVKTAVAGVAALGVAVLSLPSFFLSQAMSAVTGDSSYGESVTKNGNELVESTFETLKHVASPFEKAREGAEKSLVKDYTTVEAGELSDEEWINGHDRKALGKSTGKGLRHKYI